MTDESNFRHVNLPLNEAISHLIATLASFTLTVPNLPQEALDELATNMEADLDSPGLEESFKEYMRATIKYMRSRRTNNPSTLH